MKPCIAVAISGGVDSLMAAQLLKENGAKVVGLHFITGFESVGHRENGASDKIFSPIPGDRLRTEIEKKINLVSKKLDIPVIVIDLQKEFETCVVKHFIDTYRSGKTPNPCLVCNPSIKFGALLNHAQQLGAEKLATGHYARIQKDSNGRCHLLKGVDPVKDQSYFLAFLSQDQLGQACFPLGGLSKGSVMKMASEKGLLPFAKKESQDICFVKGTSYGKFLSRYFVPRPGSIENRSGKVLGQHKGLHLFTVGQRRGINCPASEPYYVLQMDIPNNRLVVGFKHELYQQECRIEGINWIEGIPDFPMDLYTRVRYRQKASASKVMPLNKCSAWVRFENPQEAVTPGQGAVFYLEDRVVGGGWIA